MFLDDYYGYWGDARGRIAESERFPIARFVSWVDVVTKMNFGKNGSGASFGNTGDSTTDWYEKWEECNLETTNDYGVAKIKADLEFGVPVHVGVPGHSVIAHGLASDGESYFLYLNYGWGGSADGWYKLYDSAIGGAFPGFRPKKMVQLEPLPKVCSSNVEVKWHLPNCYSNVVTGFELSCFIPGDEIVNMTYDFSTMTGAASDTNNIFVTKMDGVNNDTEILMWKHCTAGTYQFPGVAMLTTSSALEYRIQSSFVWNGEIEIQASFDGGEWQTVSSPALFRNVECYEWMTYRTFLGEHAGQSVCLRIAAKRSDGEVVLFDDFTLSDVMPYSERKLIVPASDRSATINGLESGSRFSVAVRPLFASNDGILSDYETTRISGVAHEPMPGEVTGHRVDDVVYDSSLIGDTWCITGFPEGKTTIKGVNAWAGAFSVRLQGNVTEESKLSFGWYVQNCYDFDSGVFDTITATFINRSGTQTDFLSITNSRLLEVTQNVEKSLSQFNGQSGEIVVLFRHYASTWGGDTPIVRFYAPRITNVIIPVYTQTQAWQYKTYTELPIPEVLSIKGHDGIEIDEGFYREIEIGEDSLSVTCSPTVTKLCAYPSHLSLMGDDDVTVEKITAGEFVIRMNTAKVIRRSRIILTLAATDSNGTTTYCDLSLRFDSPSEVLKTDRTRKLVCLSADTKPIVAFQFEKNMDNSGTGGFISSIGGGGISYIESPLGYAIRHDDNDGPWTKPQIDFPDDWTILAIAKLSETNNAVLFQFGSSEYDQSGFALASGGKDVVTLSHWLPHTAHTDVISVNVSGASTKYHAYALRGRRRSVELFVDGVMAGSATLQTLPEVGFQFFSVIQGAGDTGLTNAAGEHVDDWRMYDVALPDTAIVAYANTLLMFDQEKAGVEVGDVVVPERWFKKYYPSGTMSRSALSAKAANGRSAWECYVAGLDPTDEDDDLVADITFEGGVPKVSIANGEKSNRMYRILATKTLDNAEAPLDVTDVPDLSAEPYWDYRFFRISAELP